MRSPAGGVTPSHAAAAVYHTHLAIASYIRQRFVSPHDDHFLKMRSIPSESSHVRRGSSAHSRTVYKTSEFLGVVHLVSCVVLQRLVWPLPRIDTLLPTTTLRYGTALSLLWIGGLMLRATHAELAKYKQPHEPGVATTRLVTTGPFAHSRHPTYVACVGFLAPSVALVCNNSWMIVTLPFGAMAFYKILIQPEEEYLHGRFPDDYKRYCQETRRWYNL